VGAFLFGEPMSRKESVYVIRKSNGVRFCVKKDYYEKYKDEFYLDKALFKKDPEAVEPTPEKKAEAEVKVKAKRVKKATTKE
jgi:hypothetical protein